MRESERVILGNNTIRQSVATRTRASVIAFPVFESYGDQIGEWLAALGDPKPAPAAVGQVTRSLRRAITGVERVHNSARHTNMACLMRHTLEALRASEWEGARYLLMTASTLINTRALRAGASLNTPETGGELFQFPLLPDSETELLAEVAITGIVAG
jgi:hypothetical protein